MKKILLLVFLTCFYFEGQAQLFSQNFSSSSTVADYISATPTTAQFTSINNATNNPTSITGGVLRFSKSGGSTGYFARTTGFSSTPTLIQIKFDFQISSQASAGSNEATFYVGDGLTDNASVSNSNFHSRVSFNFEATSGEFSLRDVGASTNGANTYSGKQTITFVVNNSDATQTYTPPGGGTESVAKDTYDIWVGSTKEINDGAATTATAELKQIKFLYPSGSVNANLDFDNFVITELSTLPISLTSFTAKAVDKTILLNWATASEKNNQKFEVLKSADGENFKVITTVDGAGNSDSEKSYFFTDENPYSGANYYKLKQTDFNGTTTVSNVISANAKIEDIKISAFASNSAVTVYVNSPNQTDGQVALFDMNGRKLAHKGLILNKGYNQLNLDQALTPGTYFINLISAGKSTSVKFIK